jgi:large subunit ribosomal protein L20
MPRVKRGTISMKRRRNVLKKVKGYRFGRGSKERAAKEAIRHAGSYAYRDRRNKKRDFRRLWTTKINAALRGGENPISYSKFIDMLKKKNVEVDRKILAEVAEKNPKAFANLVDQVK